MPRVVHFEIPASDPAALSAFYEKALGWHFHKWSGPMDYWLITTGEDAQPGINGGMGRRQSPQDTIANTVDVPSVDEYVARITGAGGTVVAPKMSIPGVGYLAYLRDPEGNVFGIMQPDPSAS